MKIKMVCLVRVLYYTLWSFLPIGGVLLLSSVLPFLKALKEESAELFFWWWFLVSILAFCIGLVGIAFLEIFSRKRKFFIESKHRRINRYLGRAGIWLMGISGICYIITLMLVALHFFGAISNWLVIGFSFLVVCGLILHSNEVFFYRWNISQRKVANPPGPFGGD